MALHLPTTKLDRVVAQFVARQATPVVERPLRLITWAADERVLCSLAGGIWLMTRRASRPRRVAADDLLISMAVTAVLPHLLKRLVDQQRPDRRLAPGDRHGIPRSGRAEDAFPSGHAMHLGALGSVLSAYSSGWARMGWTATGLLASTRVLLLAHWVTDVIAGFAMGIFVERVVRKFTAADRAETES